MSLMTQEIPELCSMKKYPPKLSYSGNQELLYRPKVSIVGTRRPSAYTKEYTHKLAKALSSRGVVIVSGGAMGVDAIAHNGAQSHETISVLATGIDIKYPAVNRGMLEDIEKSGGLLLSQFEDGFKATQWSFVLRNELVVALGEILIITEADENSGSIRSAEYAQKMGKQIYTIPHPLNRSSGTNALLQNDEAKCIYDIEQFASMYGTANTRIIKDEFYYMCQKTPTLDTAISKFGERVYEAELEGIVKIENGLVYLV